MDGEIVRTVVWRIIISSLGNIAVVPVLKTSTILTLSMMIVKPFALEWTITQVKNGLTLTLVMNGYAAVSDTIAFVFKDMLSFQKLDKLCIL